MKKILLSILFPLIISACAGLPEILPSQAQGQDPAALEKHCRDIYPVGDWQFQHSIEVRMGQTPGGTLMGATLISSEQRTSRSVIMTLEGLVVFDAESDAAGKIKIHRALPPFETKVFAEGLMADVRLIFFPPQGQPFLSGYLEPSEMICRHSLPDESTLDTLVAADGTWQIHRYNGKGSLERRVTAPPASNKDGFPQQIQLWASEPRQYELTLTLVEATPTDR